jgi:hypothetical protein
MYSDYIDVSPALLRLLRGITAKTKDIDLEDVLDMMDEGLEPELLSAYRVSESILPLLRNEVDELVAMYGPTQGPYYSAILQFNQSLKGGDE